MITLTNVYYNLTHEEIHKVKKIKVTILNVTIELVGGL